MKKLIMTAVVVGIAVSIQLIACAAAKKCTVSGAVLIKVKAPVYIQLVDREVFEGTKKELGYAAIIQIGNDEVKEGRAPFIFENVVPGVYAIRAFQDVNGNGKLDSGKLGPQEPWGVYKSVRPLLRGPKFDEVSFEIRSDLTGIEIPVK
jgi:uncharacterized protein (DUF2141 family)